MSRFAERVRWAVARAGWIVPALFVTGLAFAWLWPVPLGRMPLSADHPVHLTRIALFADALAAGHVRGWSPVWFFGTPTGELYPVLGDLVIVGVRWLSFGSLTWPEAYAIGFSLVFAVQGLAVLRAAGALGLGAWPGLVAATLLLLDVGAYREGGWIYTVYYGVWPQSLATALTWLAFGELARVCTATDPLALRRGWASAGVAIALALLAHPMTVLVLAIAGPIAVLVFGAPSRRDLERSASTAVVAVLLGIALASWWLVPMLRHRAWMASYGWLWLPFDRMVKELLAGRWCQSMPPAVGYTIALGLVMTAIAGSRTARFFGVTAFVLWLLSCRDLVWGLRLDRVSEAFTHLQYQRFITAAKPGLFLLAGTVVGVLLRRAAAWSRGRGVAVLSFVCAAIVLVAMARGQRKAWAEIPYGGALELEHVPGAPGFEAEHGALVAWLGDRWAERDRFGRRPGEAFYRVAVHDDRNTHWFMDVPALAGGVPIFKLGFTPGDNFVHKPEQASRALLERARVRYEIVRRSLAPRDAVASFGSIHVREREGWRETGIATLAGPGTVETITDAVDEGLVRVRVTGTQGPTRLTFGVAGFPRWRLVGPEGEIEWFEAPVVGREPVATQAERRSGALRGGKAQGDDGSEPTLVAAVVEDGEYTLSYRARDPFDVLAAVLALAGSVLVLALAWPASRGSNRARGQGGERAGEGVLTRCESGASRATRAAAWFLRRGTRFAHPSVLAAVAVLALVGFGVAQARGRAREASRAVAWASTGRAATLVHVRARYLKTDMLMRPALVFARRHADPAVAVFERVHPGQALTGWFALDDDDAKETARGHVHLRVEARASEGPADAGWRALFDANVRHRPGRVPLALPIPAGGPVDVRIVVTSEGRRPPELGLDLVLEGER